MSSSVRIHSRGPSRSGRPSQPVGTGRPQASRTVGNRSIVPTGSSTTRPGRESRAAHDQRHAEQGLVVDRALQHQPVVAEEVAVVAGEEHERVVGEATRGERREHAADAVVELAHHAVVRGEDGELLALVEQRPAGIRPLEGGAAESLRPLLVEGRLRLELARPHLGQDLRHVGGVVAVAPRPRRVERMVRIGEADPGEERAVDAAEPLDGAVGDPRRGMILFGELVRPGLGVIPAAPGGLGLHQAQPLESPVATVAEESSARSGVPSAAARSPSSSARRRARGGCCGRRSPARRGRSRSTARASPPGRAPSRRPTRSARSGSPGSRTRSGPCRTARSRSRRRRGGRRATVDRLRKVDAVADHAVRARILPGQDGGAGGLAERVLRPAAGEARSRGGKAVDGRGRPKRIAVGADGGGFVLIGGEQQHVHGWTSGRTSSRRGDGRSGIGAARWVRVIIHCLATHRANTGAPRPAATTKGSSQPSQVTGATR